jgi:ATP-binding cassette subfamily F protein uup
MRTAFLLSCQTLGKSYGWRPLFSGITLGISEGERLGLIGPNGSGKSTLLKLLSGLETADEGVVAARRGLRLEYVPQEDSFPEGLTVTTALEQALSGGSVEPDEVGARVAIMLARGSFPKPDQPVSTLSGGWRKRLAIACALIGEPNLVLLDEPTNHLDVEGVLWLEELLKGSAVACIVVTHDRYFLQNVTNRIVELNACYEGGCFGVNGNYSEFLARREEYLASQAHQELALASRVRREIEWLRQGAQARSTKEGARIRQAGKLIDELAEIRSRNSQDRTAAIAFDASLRKSRDLVVAEGIEKSVDGKTLFHRLDLLLSPGTRIGLIGPNGSGKTTLLRVVTGDLQPDRGKVQLADGLRAVVFDQHREQVDRSLTLRQALGPNGDTVVYRGRAMHIASWAKRFLFRTQDLERPVETMSGGEHARILLAQLMLRPADVLILDEPTNDLDIPTLDVLEDSLLEFPGAVILVTHDRFLLDRVSTELLALDGAGGARYFADYSQWERARAAAPAVPAAAPVKVPRPAAGTPRLTTSEQRELGRIEGRIEAAEAEVAALNVEVSSPAVATDHVRLRETWQRLEEAQTAVAGLYARWEELETKRAAAG